MCVCVRSKLSTLLSLLNFYLGSRCSLSIRTDNVKLGHKIPLYFAGITNWVSYKCDSSRDANTQNTEQVKHLFPNVISQLKNINYKVVETVLALSRFLCKIILRFSCVVIKTILFWQYLDMSWHYTIFRLNYFVSNAAVLTGYISL